MNAEIFVNGNFATSEGNINVLGPHPVDRGIQGIDVTGEFDDEFTDLVGGDLGTDDVGGDVEVFGEAVGDGHLDVATWEGEGDALFHGIFWSLGEGTVYYGS
jgi:hypothetical protein